jgi:hypothetical protein
MNPNRARIRLVAFAAALISVIAFTSSAGQAPPRAADSNLAARAQPVGKPLSTIIEFGEQYETGDVPYLATITVAKVLRGAPAEALVKSASSSNPEPKPGFEYIAARVRFEFSARVAPANDVYMLDASQFTSISPDGAEYPAPNLESPPNPGIRASVRSGDSVEGWVVLLVPRADRTPLMLFAPNIGTTSHTGASSIFRLYSATRLGSDGRSS